MNAALDNVALICYQNVNFVDVEINRDCFGESRMTKTGGQWRKGVHKAAETLKPGHIIIIIIISFIKRNHI